MATIRDYVGRLEDGKSGTRFLDLYEFRQKHPPTPVVRVSLWLAALLFVVGGLAIGWLPGPGGFIAIFGFAVIAMEFRAVALILDRAERLGRGVWAWLRRQVQPADHR